MNIHRPFLSNRKTMSAVRGLSDDASVLNPSSIKSKFIHRSNPEFFLRVRRTQEEMMLARKYTPQTSFNLDLTVEEFIKNYNAATEQEFSNKLSGIYTKNEDDGTTDIAIVYYFFSDYKDGVPKDVGKSVIQTLAQQMREIGSNHGILITEGGLTSNAKTQVETLLNKFRIEHFKTKRLGFNVTKHSSNPKHILLSKSEKTAFFKENPSVKFKQLPKTYTHDPIARYYDFKEGDVVMVFRRNISIFGMVNLTIAFKGIAVKR